MASAFFRRVGKSCHWTWCQCITLFNVFLGLVAVLLGIAAFILVYYEEIPLPGFIVESVEAELAEAELEISWRSAGLDPRGGILFRELEITQAGQSHPALEASSLYLKLNLFRLLVGDARPDQIEIDNGTLYYPAQFSPSGVSEVLLKEANLKLHRRGTSLVVDKAILTAGHSQLRVVPGSSWQFSRRDRQDDEDSTIAKQPDTPTDEKPATKLADIYRQLITIRKSLDMSRNAIIHIAFQPEGSQGAHRFHLDGQAEALRYLHFISTGEINARTTALLHNGELTDWELTLSTTALQTPFPVGAPRANLHAYGQKLDYPYHFTLLTGDLIYNEVVLNSPGLAGVIEKNGQQLELFTHIENGAVSLHFAGDLGKITGTLKLEATANTDPLFKLVGIAEEDFVDTFAFHRAPSVIAELELVPELMNSRLIYTLYPTPMNMQGVELDLFSAKGSIHWPILHVETMSMALNDYELEAEYLNEMTDGRFRLLLDGHFLPEDFNPLMAQWWANLWARFAFNGPAPYADLDIRGTWGTDERKAFGYVEGEKVAFEGLESAIATAKIKYEDKVTDVFNLVALGQNGGVGGDLQFRDLPDGMTLSRFSLQSTIKLNDLALVLGEDFTEVANMFSPDTKPEVSFRGGILFGGDRRPVRDIRLQAIQLEPFLFHDYPLQHLTLNGLLTSDFLQIDQYTIGIADGLAYGNFLIENRAQEELLTFETTLIGGDYKQLRDILGMGDTTDDSTGKVGLTLQASGKLGDMLSYEGEGQFKIEEAELARLRILGGLSSLLEGTWFNQTTIVVEEIHGSFTLKKELLDFEELDLLARNSSLRAKGTYNMSNSALDFRVNTYLVDSNRGIIRSLLTPVMRPVGEVLELILRGTLDDPRWRFAVDPRNLLSRNFGRVEDKAASPKPEVKEETEKSPPLAPGEEWYEWKEDE